MLVKVTPGGHCWVYGPRTLLERQVSVGINMEPVGLEMGLWVTNIVW